MNIESNGFISTTPSLQLLVETTQTGVYGYANTLNKDGVWESSPVETVKETNAGWQITSSSGILTIDGLEHIGIEDPHQHIATWERWITKSLYPMNSITWKQGGHGEWHGNHVVVVMRDQHVAN